MSGRTSKVIRPRYLVFCAVVGFVIYILSPTITEGDPASVVETTAPVAQPITKQERNEGRIPKTAEPTDPATLEVAKPTTAVANATQQFSLAPTILSPQTTTISSTALSTVSSIKNSPFYRSKDRMLLPLLLTHICYHGTSLLSTTIKGWILHLLIPQGNIDLVLYYTKPQDREQIIKLLSLTKTEPDPFITNLPKIHKIPSEIFEDGDFMPLSIPLEKLRDKNTTLQCGGGEENERKYSWWNEWKDKETGNILRDGGEPEWFVTPHSSEVKIRLQLTKLSFPPYIHSDPLLLKNESWMRCGCPPFCPAKRAGVDYVQGTRWYTYDLMRQPLMQQYRYWMKLDVDIWFYRPLKFNFVESMLDKQAEMMHQPRRKKNAGDDEGAEGAEGRGEGDGSRLPVPVFMHTGKKYNGAGCSTNLHQALLDYAKMKKITIPAKDKRWWKDDDDTYYSNFVVSQTEFHLSRNYLELAKYLNNYPKGFFKHRWTDQSLFHKVYGMFFGPNEEDFVVNHSELRCTKGKGSPPALPHAVFWHSKKHWEKKVLKKCM